MNYGKNGGLLFGDCGGRISNLDCNTPFMNVGPLGPQKIVLMNSQFEIDSCSFAPVNTSIDNDEFSLQIYGMMGSGARTRINECEFVSGSDNTMNPPVLITDASVELNECDFSGVTNASAILADGSALFMGEDADDVEIGSNRFIRAESFNDVYGAPLFLLQGGGRADLFCGYNSFVDEDILQNGGAGDFVRFVGNGDGIDEMAWIHNWWGSSCFTAVNISSPPRIPLWANPSLSWTNHSSTCNEAPALCGVVQTAQQLLDLGNQAMYQVLAISYYRMVIEMYPNSPQAVEAAIRLKKLGVKQAREGEDYVSTKNVMTEVAQGVSQQNPTLSLYLAAHKEVIAAEAGEADAALAVLEPMLNQSTTEDDYRTVAKAIMEVDAASSPSGGLSSAHQGIQSMRTRNAERNLLSYRGGSVPRLSSSGETILEPKFSLFNTAYPNPFNPIVHLMMNLPERGNLDLSAYNMLGQHVRTVFSGEATAGRNQFSFDAEGLAAGTYFIRASMNGKSETVRVMYMP